MAFLKVQCWVRYYSSYYINDLPKCLNYVQSILFADGSTIYFIETWFNANGLLVNASKANYILFHSSKQKNTNVNFELKIGKQILEKKATVKFLRTLIDECLTWKYQIDQVVTKIAKSLVIIRIMKSIVYQKDLKALYYLTNISVPHIWN